MKKSRKALKAKEEEQKKKKEDKLNRGEHLLIIDEEALPCLMAQEEENEVTSKSTSFSSCSISRSRRLDMHDMFKELSAKFKKFKLAIKSFSDENLSPKSDNERSKDEPKKAKPSNKAFRTS
ncbi:hypothetical protein Dimus_029275 [Dionaea muscipula]